MVASDAKCPCPAVFDLHVHSAPCLLPRRAGDVQTVEEYERAGFAGCVLKGHFEPTVGRAAAAARSRALHVLGGIVLNQAVGGLNPVAVETSLGLGARIVWMPTLDARAHREAGLPVLPSARTSQGLAVPPSDRGTEADVRRILGLVAEADAVVATGHLSAEEAAWLVRAARKEGVRRILLTHPSFTVPALSASATRELLDFGAFAEVTAYQLLHQSGWDAARLAAFLRALPAERCILTSDAGQPNSPAAPEAMALLLEVLGAEGLDPGALKAMCSEIPARLVAA
jgi:Family of unknown function (DUF6282)